MDESQQSLAEDLLLIHETLEGKPASFRRLVEKYQDYVYDLCLRVLGQAQDAEDVAQESFIKVYEHLGDFRPGYKFSNWVYTIALNQCRSRLRRAKILKFLSLDGMLAGENGSRELASGEAESSYGLEAREESLELQRVISQIPDTLREAFVLRYVHDKPLEEIAGILNLSLANVKVRLHRVRKLLLEKLGKSGETV